MQNTNSSLYTKHFTVDRGGRTYESLSKAGWLVFENNAWVLYPVQFHRVEDSLLEEKYHLESDKLKQRTELDRRNRLLNRNTSIYFSVKDNKTHPHHGGMRLVYSKVDDIRNTTFPGAAHGFVVLTGQPGRCRRQNRETGKHLDFVFEDKGQTKIIVDYETILQFKQANAPKASDQKKGLNLPKKLNESKENGYPGIPVFYLPNSDGKPESLGLSLMYRLPYKNTLHGAIKHSSENNFSDKLDFAECMFGKIEDTKIKNASSNYSLRGRVQFEDATTDSISLSRQVNTILGNPKPTYYPNYIQQNEENENYKTLMDSDVVLRGWKRYPVKDETNTISIGEGQGNVVSHFMPLDRGTVFEGKIHFHNLKKEELGALLWAITWGGDKNLSHAVGMGKPYGFGQIKAEVSSFSYLRNDSEDNEYKESSSDETKAWINDFTKFMENVVVGWKQSSQLKELLAMADPANAKRNGWKLTHMILDHENRINEFVDAKRRNNRFFLASYSQDQQELRLVNPNGHGGNVRQGGRGNGFNNQRQPQQRPAHTENGIANNDVPICVLLGEKTKKGGWKAAVKDTPGICGPIINTAEVPSDKKPGDEIKLKVAAVKGDQTSFRYEG